MLYVDDLQTNLILFQATFERDYNIILAESAAKALEILKEQEIQVLVTDQRMPDMTGTELLEIVAAEYPEVRRFLLTAFTDFETVVEAVNKGHIHGYINKPLQADEVRISINNSLEMYYLRRKNSEIMIELEKANQELMGLDGMKSEIIKVISQEIRNPLNRIMGTLHLLKDKMEGQELASVINILDSSVSRLEDFSSMTEQISILKSPGHTLDIIDLNLKQVIEYGMIEVSEQMKEKGIELDLQNGASEVTIMGESDLLVSCLVNILRNAMDHTGKGETITIKTAQSENQVMCEVIDQGLNYSDKLLEDLTSQLTATDHKLNLNLGIDLALSQMIMEAHGGNIVFEKANGSRASVKMLFNGHEPAEPEQE
ncbi:MAG: hybrid sensor histidine kinase/response regulator [Bacteroidales bacterium]|nr:hybrid sensor histidine kinase/response regulator [Bacteroidales bacterium]